MHGTPFPYTPASSPASSKPLGLQDQPFLQDVNDGIYCEGHTTVHIPPLTEYCPTTPKIVIPPDDYICKNNQRPLLVQFRHTLKIQIDIIGEEPIVIDSGCYLISIGLKDCEKLLRDDVEIMPCFDYEKVIGLEVWVPEYTQTDEYLRDFDTDSTQDDDSDLGQTEDAITIEKSAGPSTSDRMQIAILKERADMDEARIPQLIEQAMQEEIS